MNYLYCPNDPERYATNLHRDSATRNLAWDSARGQDTLLVQTPFGQDPAEQMPRVCTALADTELRSGAFTEILPGIRGRIVTAPEKARSGGCPLNGEASTYTVFSCQTDGENCRIFAPQNSAMITSCCHVPLEMHIELSPVTRREGVFKKKDVPTGFYRMNFPSPFSASYRDGDICYRLEELEIPVTREMMEHRYAYIRADRPPILVSENRGLKLV
jgi:hypothetical protein